MTDVKCGRCEVPLEGPAEAKPQDRFSCPVCGDGDSLDNIMREVGDYAQEQAVQHLENVMAGVARGSKVLTFTPRNRPKRQHRFVIDLNLH